MAAQETYQIQNETALVLREKSPHRGSPLDIAIIKSQHDRLVDLLYKDAERGYRYDTVTVNRYAVYLAPVDARFLEDSGKRIGEFSRLDMAEMVCAALNATLPNAHIPFAGPITVRSPAEHAELQSRMNAIAAEKTKSFRSQI